MGLTLREVSERVAGQGERIPTSTLARIEHGKLDPGVRRLHLLLRLYDVPPHLVSDLVELETLAVAKPPEGDLETLYRDGVEHWKRGDVAQGLAHLFAVREHAPADEASRLLRQKATLTFAIAARSLGKFRLAKQIVEDLLVEPPDPSLIVNVLTLASGLWRGVGSLDVAIAFVRRARELLRPDDRQNTAWVLHQEARLLLEAGDAAGADRVLEQALDVYRELNDTYGEIRGRILRTRVLEAEGKLRQALESCEKVIRLSEQGGHESLTLSGRLESARLSIASGREREGAELLNECLGKSILLGDRHAEFLAHYHLWKVHERLNDPDRARLELDAARYVVQFLDEHTPETDEIRQSLG